jgi:hypothetical protein
MPGVPQRPRRRPSAWRAAAWLAACSSGLACADLAQTAAVLSEAVLRNEQARRQQEVVRGQAGLVQVLATRAEYGPGGRPVVRAQVRNGSRFDVTAVALRVTYLNGQTAVAQDNSCGVQALIRPGQASVLSCPYYQVRGANSYRVDVTNVQFR